MDINANAPAVARAEAEVAAPPELVFEVIADIAAWPSWNPEVRSASLDGPLATGTRFRWKAGPGTITSTFQTLEPPGRIVWTGDTFGIRGIHVHTFTARGAGTNVVSEESWDGMVVRLFRGSLQASLQKALVEGLRHLKTEAERRAGAR